ncbi:MAG: nicotinic acid mononucleotide adenylyltransferase, partial [Alphaproteobacteria bacterium]
MTLLTDIRRGLPAGGRRVGLLGGSFNPAHEGHLHVSRLAIARLGLDAVWWLVSPQNPLKGEDGMAPRATRMAGARRAARDPRIFVSDIEARTGTRYTADILRLMINAFPRRRFVWLMGADNMVQLPLWRDWRAIPHLVP